MNEKRNMKELVTTLYFIDRNVNHCVFAGSCQSTFTKELSWYNEGTPGLKNHMLQQPFLHIIMRIDHLYLSRTLLQHTTKYSVSLSLWIQELAQPNKV